MSVSEATRRRKMWAIQHHPDKGGNTESFQRIQGCWVTLMAHLNPIPPLPNSPNQYPNLPSIWWERLLRVGILREGISFDEASNRWARWASDHQGSGGDPILFGYMETSWGDYVEWYGKQTQPQPQPQPQPAHNNQNNYMNVNERPTTRAKTPPRSPKRATVNTNPLRRSRRTRREPDWLNRRRPTATPLRVQKGEIGKKKATKRSQRALAHLEAAAQAINAAANTGGADATANLEVAQANLSRAAEEAAREGEELNLHVEVAQQAVEAAIIAPNVAAAVHAIVVANAHINEAAAEPLRRSTRTRREPDWLNRRRPTAAPLRVQKGEIGKKKATKRSQRALAHLEAAAQAINAAANTGGADATANLEVAQVNLSRAAEEAAREGVELNPHVEVAQQAVEAAIGAPNEAVARDATDIANVHINEATGPHRRSTRTRREPDWLNRRRPTAIPLRVQKGEIGKKKATKRSQRALAHLEAAAQAINAAANTGGDDAIANLEVAQVNFSRAAEEAAREGVELNPHVEVAQQAVEAAIGAPNEAVARNATDIANVHINEAKGPLRRSTRTRREPDWLNRRRPTAAPLRVQKGEIGKKKATKRSQRALAHLEAAAQAINAAANTGGADATANLEVAQANLSRAAEEAAREVLN
jgi:hypothetical protein